MHPSPSRTFNVRVYNAQPVAAAPWRSPHPVVGSRRSVAPNPTGFGLPDALRALDATSMAGAADRQEDVYLRSLHSLVEAVHRSRTNHPTAALEEALSRAGLQAAP